MLFGQRVTRLRCLHRGFAWLSSVAERLIAVLEERNSHSGIECHGGEKLWIQQQCVEALG